jgi:hypothetical protein
MSEQDDTQPAATPEPSAGGDASAPPGPGGEQMTPEQQAEMQQQLEEQLRQIRVQDIVAESAVSIINLTARRIGKEDERDLEQARIGIEAVSALAGLVEGELAGQLRAALSEIQMMYAKAAGTPAPAQGGGDAPPAGGPAAAQPTQGPGQQPGPQQPGGDPPPRLWTPGR